MLSTCTFATVSPAKNLSKSAKAVFVVATADPVAVSGDLAGLPAEVRDAATAVAKAASKGKVAEVASGVAANGLRVFVVGVGSAAKVSAESLRKVGAAVVRTARRGGMPEVTLVAPQFGGTIDSAAVISALTEGAVLASWEYVEYVGTRRAKDAKEKVTVRLELLGGGKEAAATIERATIVAESTNFARTVASRPGNNINPVTLAGVAKDLAKEVGLKFSALDEKQMEKLGMGGILGVGAGSPTPPRMIVLEHKPSNVKKGTQPLLVVGKSITFDTGGISIKPADQMFRMIYDKSGGMAVLGLMRALALSDSPVHVVGILTSAENHVSGTAYRPGDILTMYNGITVEITNTDAEGRLVLGDAIAWGIETYRPSAVVDLATLTGGCVVALGKSMAGLFSNSDALTAEVTAASEGAGEKLWRLPVNDEIRELLKSDLADVVNSAGRYASPCTGAAFVSLFVPADNSVPWVHLDIAGVADTDKELGYVGKGSTGFGVRTLVNWVGSRAKA